MSELAFFNNQREKEKARSNVNTAKGRRKERYARDDRGDEWEEDRLVDSRRYSEWDDRGGDLRMGTPRKYVCLTLICTSHLHITCAHHCN